MATSIYGISLDGLTPQQVTAVRTYQQIKMQPQTWKQEEWRDTGSDDDEEDYDPTRCGSKLCFLGHVANNDAGQWATDDAYDSHFSYLIARKGDDSESIDYMDIDLTGFNTVSIPVTPVMNRAATILGISLDAADDISAPGNTLWKIRELIKKHLKVDPETGKAIKEPVKIDVVKPLTSRPECDYDVPYTDCPGCLWDKKQKDALDTFRNSDQFIVYGTYTGRIGY